MVSSLPDYYLCSELTFFLALKRQIHNGKEEVEGPLHEVDVLRRQDPISPVTNAVASTLNGGTGVVGGAVGTGEQVTGSVAGTAEHAVSSAVPRMF